MTELTRGQSLKLFIYGIFTILISIFVLIFGVIQEVPRSPIADLFYFLGVGLLYLGISILVIHYRRLSASYTVKDYPEYVLRRLLSKSWLVRILSLTSLVLSIYGIIGTYLMIHITPIFGGFESYAGGSAFLVLSSLLTVLMSFVLLLVTGGVAGSIIELKRKHYIRTPDGIMMMRRQVMEARDRRREIKYGKKEKPSIYYRVFHTIVMTIVIVLIIVLVVNKEKYLYHSIPGEIWYAFIFVPAIVSMLLGFLLLLSFDANKMLKISKLGNLTTSSIARKKFNHVIILIITFSLLLGVATWHISIIVNRRYFNNDELYLVQGYIISGSPRDSSTTGILQVPIEKDDIDDIKVYVKGVAKAPCNVVAKIEYRMTFFDPNNPSFNETYHREGVDIENCTKGEQSIVIIGTYWWGFNLESIDNLSIEIEIISTPSNIEEYVEISVMKLNDEIRLHLAANDLLFMYGGIAFACIFFIVVASINILVNYFKLIKYYRTLRDHGLIGKESGTDLEKPHGDTVVTRELLSLSIPRLKSQVSIKEQDEINDMTPPALEFPSFQLPISKKTGDAAPTPQITAFEEKKRNTTIFKLIMLLSGLTTVTPVLVLVYLSEISLLESAYVIFSFGMVIIYIITIGLIRKMLNSNNLLRRWFRRRAPINFNKKQYFNLIWFKVIKIGVLIFILAGLYYYSRSIYNEQFIIRDVSLDGDSGFHQVEYTIPDDVEGEVILELLAEAKTGCDNIAIINVSCSVWLNGNQVVSNLILMDYDEGYCAKNDDESSHAAHAFKMEKISLGEPLAGSIVRIEVVFNPTVVEEKGHVVLNLYPVNKYVTFYQHLTDDKIFIYMFPLVLDVGIFFILLIYIPALRRREKKLYSDYTPEEKELAREKWGINLDDFSM
ncbi:MAG: hypothetical protein ACTSXP_12230 [Promethearchaeota archaeon]